MVEPISGTAVVLFGAGAWLADKMLGPSAEALGQQLQSYCSGRLRTIFSRAQQKLAPPDVQALPPGFMMQFCQRASFSEDDEVLTEAWANLLASAAKGYQSRHLAYVEILSQLSAHDAGEIERLVPTDTFYGPGITKPVNLKMELRHRLAKEIKAVSETEAEAQAEFERLIALDLRWPGRVTAARVHYSLDGTERPISGGISDHQSSYDNLYRVGLIEFFEVDISMSPYATGLEGVLVTMLGIGFVQTCRGKA